MPIQFSFGVLRLFLNFARSKPSEVNWNAHALHDRAYALLQARLKRPLLQQDCANAYTREPSSRCSVSSRLVVVASLNSSLTSSQLIYVESKQRVTKIERLTWIGWLWLWLPSEPKRKRESVSAWNEKININPPPPKKKTSTLCMHTYRHSRRVRLLNQPQPRISSNPSIYPPIHPSCMHATQVMLKPASALWWLNLHKVCFYAAAVAVRRQAEIDDLFLQDAHMQENSFRW